MAGMADNEERKATLKDFLNNHVKTSVTVLMILGTLLCIILIVMGELLEKQNVRKTGIFIAADTGVLGFIVCWAAALLLCLPCLLDPWGDLV